MKLKNTEEVVNVDTGEVQTITKTYNIKTSTEEFFMTFINSMSGLFNIHNGTDRKVLDQLCKRVEFNSNIVYLTTSRRREIEGKLNITKQTLSNSLASLKKLKIISGNSGEYELNPFIFWKGTTDERSKLIKNGGLELKIKFVGSYEK